MKISELNVPQSVREVLQAQGICELFPPQADCIREGVLEGKNILLASPTASGKTLIAELCALKHILEGGGKAIYLCPLRALASEKFEEFKKYTSIQKPNGTKVSVGISTGDFDTADNWLAKYDVIVTTNEKADSLLRHRAEWMDSISAVIVDEIHLLNEAGRGPTLEIVLARLMQYNANIQILALSATVNNVDEIAGWLNAKYIVTSWRPINLKEGVILQDEIQYKDGENRKIEQETRFTVINMVLNTLRNGGQALIFASTRKNAVSSAKQVASHMDKILIPKTGSKIVKKSLEEQTKSVLEKEAHKILESGERTQIGEELADLVRNGVAYHHAGLPGAQRTIIEQGFKDRKIKVLTATPTLAWGVNLPARTVIIQDYRRFEAGLGNYPIPVLDYKQMAGRAGRPKYDKFGESVIVAKTADESDFVMENYVLAKPERIWSRLAVEKILRTHVLSTIASDYAHTEEGIYEFFRKTFYAYQYDVKAIQNVIAKILRFLHDEEMICVMGDDIVATKLGKRISELYIDPLSGIIIRDALQTKPPVLTEFSLLQLIAHTPDMGPIMRPYQREMEKLTDTLEEHQQELLVETPSQRDYIGYADFLGEVKMAMVLNAWIEETSEDRLLERFNVQPGDLYRTIESAKWLLHAVERLAPVIANKNKEVTDLSNELVERVSMGIKRELMPIVTLEGVGRVRGRIIFNAGFQTVEDLKRASIEELTALPSVGPRLAKKIKEQVGGYDKKDEWEEDLTAATKAPQETRQKGLFDF
ncbi:DEAD/DEAH box helicase [Candidatus Bathycorpusculum sp.]|uniref:DEAD/DEAH box helicase n=1 Tax=Candidatus Bathycorpusculum sp. TaxID=2994959 RepID=UPI00282508F7|nr:DEAD/DEAH box helicase [Candidatus Termitimicrobium sp.]MCL2685301.1 DEAD/DEAH box helicase [Candidatus Termitimicrobium sp.]